MDSNKSSQLVIHRISFKPIKAASKSYCEVNINETTKRIEGKYNQDLSSFTYSLNKFNIPVNMNSNDDITISIYLPQLGITTLSGSISIPIKELIHENFFVKGSRGSYCFKILSKKNVDRGDGTISYSFTGNQILIEILESPKVLNALDYILEMIKIENKAIFEKEVFEVLAKLLKVLLPKHESKKTKSSKKDLFQVKDKDRDECKKKMFEIFKSLFLNSNINMKTTYVKNGIFKLIVMMLKCDDKYANLNSMEYLKNFFTSISHQKAMIKDGVLNQLLRKLKSKDDKIVFKVFDILMYFEESLMNELINAGVLDLLLDILSKGSISIKMRALELCKNLVKSYQDEIILSGITDVLSELLKDLLEKSNDDLFYQILLYIDLFDEEKLSTFNPLISNYILTYDPSNTSHFELGLKIIEKLILRSQSEKVKMLDTLNIYYNTCDNAEKKALIFQLVLKLSRRDDLLSSIKESGFLEILLNNAIETKDPQAIKEFLSWFISLNVSSGKILSIIHPHIFKFIEIGKESKSNMADILELSFKLCINSYEHLDKDALIRIMRDIIYDKTYFSSLTLFQLMIDLYEKLLENKNAYTEKTILISSIANMLKHFYFSEDVATMKRLFKCLFLIEGWESYLSLSEFKTLVVNNNFEQFYEEEMKMWKVYARNTRESDCFSFLEVITSTNISKEDFLYVIKDVPNYIQNFTSSNIFSNLKNVLSKVKDQVYLSQLEYFYHLSEFLIDQKEVMQNNGIIETILLSTKKWPNRDLPIRLFQTFVDPKICLKRGLIPDIVDLLLVSTKLSSWIVEHLLIKITDDEIIVKYFPTIVKNVIKLITDHGDNEIFVRYLKLLFSKDSKYKMLFDSDTFFTVIKALLESTDVQDIKYGIELLEDYIKSHQSEIGSFNFENIVIHLLFLLTSPSIDFKSNIVDVIKLIPHNSFLLSPDFDILECIDLLEKRYFKDIGILTDYLSIYNFMELSRLIDEYNYVHFSFDSFLNLVGFSTLGSFILSYEKYLVSMPTKEDDILGIYYNNKTNKGFLFFKSSTKLSIEHHPIEDLKVNMNDNSIQFGSYISINTLTMEILTGFDDTSLNYVSPTYILEDMRLYSITPSMKPYNTYQINVSELNDPSFAGLKTDEIMKLNSNDIFLRHMGTVVIIDREATTLKKTSGTEQGYLNQTVARYLNHYCKKNLDLKWTIQTCTYFNSIYNHTARCLLVQGDKFLFAICLPFGKMHIGRHEVRDAFIISFKSPSTKEPLILFQSHTNMPIRITKEEIFVGEGTDLYINLIHRHKSFSNPGFSLTLPAVYSFMSEEAQKLLTGKKIGWNIKEIYTCDISTNTEIDDQQYPNFLILSLMIYTLKYLPLKLQDEIIDLFNEIFKAHNDITDNWENIVNNISSYLNNETREQLKKFSKSYYNFHRAATTIHYSITDTGSKYFIKIHDLDEDCLITNVFIRVGNRDINTTDDRLMYLYASNDVVDDFECSKDSKHLTTAYYQLKANYKQKLRKYDNNASESDPIFGDVLKYLDIQKNKTSKNRVRDEKQPLAINYIHAGMNELVLLPPVHAKTLILYTPSVSYDLQIEVIPIYIKETPESLPPLPISRCNLIPDMEIISRRCVYERDFDENGVLYYIGTRNSVDWVNPLTNNEVSITLSHGLFTHTMSKNNVIGRNVRENTYWGGSAPQYFILNLKRYKVKITHYTIRHGYSLDNSFVHNFKLEGSNDGINWEQIHACVVSPFSYAFQSYTYKLDRSYPYYQYFKFTQKGNYAMTYNEQVGSGAPYLCIGGFELYGDLIELP